MFNIVNYKIKIIIIFSWYRNCVYCKSFKNVKTQVSNAKMQRASSARYYCRSQL